jgi:hypothetical protein
MSKLRCLRQFLALSHVDRAKQYTCKGPRLRAGRVEILVVGFFKFGNGATGRNVQSESQDETRKVVEKYRTMDGMYPHR